MNARLLLTLALILPCALSPGRDFVMARDGSGDLRTVQEAVNAAPDYCKQEATVIRIKSGIYREKVTVPPNKQRLHLIVEDAATTVITWVDYALRKGSTGHPMGTSATSTVFLYGNDFLAENLTFENRAGEGRDIAQACAVTVDAERVAFIRCRFIGNQDTIYTYGKAQKQYFRDCHIEGTTDFIFGASTCWFEGCTILCKTATLRRQARRKGLPSATCSINAASSPLRESASAGSEGRGASSPARYGWTVFLTPISGRRAGTTGTSPMPIKPSSTPNPGTPVPERKAPA